MDWTLGFTNPASALYGLLTIVMLAFFISIFWAMLFSVPDNKKKKKIHYASCTIGSLLISYVSLAFIATIEINELTYKQLYDRVQPYMDDQKIQDLLKDAKQDGKISSAERYRLYNRVNQIEDAQIKIQKHEEGSIAKKVLLGT